MNCENRSVQAVFHEAVENHRPDQWPVFLNSACGSDDELRRLVQRLLDAHVHVSSFMAIPMGNIEPGFRPAIEMGGSSENSVPIGTVIDRYKLLEQIGEGGMGVVYVAEQTEPVRRRVAVKIIKPGMDSREVISRFEVERQALAIMDHPNIARVLDAGTTNAGLPYFVMELVRGLPITEYCDKARLTPRQRLDLFVTVCQAVQHAHLKGIIHRDLKPSNVMITLHDGIPVVKVIDFGVAKAMNQQFSKHSIYTAFSQILGTPLYMSPEQAELSGLDIDTRSDVYSLGVLLYELLTGLTPFDRDTFNKAGLDEKRRMIREDEPARPSRRVNTLGAQAISTLSQKRGIDERRLSQFLRSEIDWIVMKALEKDRTRRYESASAFAADLQRYLDDLPVEACPPSASYRLQKYARRNKVVLITSGLIAVSLLLGTAISIWQAVEATSARRQADQQRQRAEASFEKALEAVDQMLTRVGDESLRDVPQMELVRQKILQDAVEFYRGFLAERPDHAALRYQTAVVFARLGDIYVDLGQAKERDAAFLEARRMLEELHAEFPNDVHYRAELANAFNRLGFHTGTTSKECESFFRRAIELLQPVVDTLPADTEIRRENVSSMLANSYRSRGLHLTILGRLEEAEQAFRTTIALCEKDPAWGQDVLASCHENLASLHETRGRLANAIEAIEQAVAVREAVVKTNPQSAFYRFELGQDWFARGNFLVKANRLQEAEHAYRQALDLGQPLAADFPSTRHYKSLVQDGRMALIRVSFQLGQKDEAARMLDESAPGTVRDYLARAKLYETVGRLDQAGADLQQAIKVAASEQPPNAESWIALGSAHFELEKLDTALECYRKALTLAPDRGDVLAFIAEIQIKRGQFEEATATAAKAIKAAPEHHRVWHARGFLHDARGQFAQAVFDYTKALEFNPGWWIHKRRGLSYFKMGRYDEALADIAKAVELEPADVTNLTWISPSLTAACPEERFRKGILKLADKTIEQTGRKAEAFAARATILVAMQEFALARADFDLATKDPKASHFVHCQSALAALVMKDKDGYRQRCAAMIERFHDSRDRDALYFTAWTTAIGPSAVVSYETPLMLAQRAAEMGPQAGTLQESLGAVHYRAGKFEEANQHLTAVAEAPESAATCPAYIWYFLAMTNYRLGKTEQAQSWLDQATAYTAKTLADDKDEMNERLAWNRRMTLELLDAEARALLASGLETSPREE